ncbi:7255_t:CDS:1, partial [Racocetra fulgida]
TEFRVCVDGPDGVFNVNMNPDTLILGQNVTFYIFATVTGDAGDDGSLTVDFFDEDDGRLLRRKSFDLPSGIKANEAFN